MLKLMIVEDNDFERNALLRNIQWDILGIQVADTAFNGQDGLEKALRHKPDIIVSDVMMPVMNGIDMAKKILDMNPRIRFVFTSGYSDVAYLKQAMEVRAYNYIVKPVKPEELTSTMKKMASEIIDEKLLDTKMSDMKERYDSNFEFLQEKFIKDLLQDDRLTKNRSGVFSQAALLNIDLSGNYLLVMVEIDGDKDDDSFFTVAAVEDLIRHFCSEFRDAHCLFIRIGDGGMLAYIPCAKDNLAVAEEVVRAVAERLRRDQARGSYRFSMGVSEISGDICDIATLFKQSVLSAGRKIEIGYGHIIRYGDLDGIGDEDSTDGLPAQLHDLYSGIIGKLYDGEDTGEDLRTLTEIHFPDKMRLDRIKAVFIGLIGALSRKMSDHEESFEAISENEEDVYYHIVSAATIPDILAYVRKILASLSAYLGRKKMSKDDFIVQEVVGILDKEYASQITLNDLSDKVFLSPNYLRVFFKNKMGVSIQDYLTRIRIQKAKELLKDNQYKIYEVGEMTGYPNNTYFNIVFKNHTGMPPGEYRSKFSG